MAGLWRRSRLRGGRTNAGDVAELNEGGDDDDDDKREGEKDFEELGRAFSFATLLPSPLYATREE